MAEPNSTNPESSDTPEKTPESPPTKKPETDSAKPDKPAEEKKPETGVKSTSPATPKSQAPAPSAAKPSAAKASAKGGGNRRFFLLGLLASPFAIAWVSFSAAMVGLLLGTARFFFPNVLSEPPSSFNAGDVENFEENVITDQYKDQGVWVVRSRQGDPNQQGRDVIYALSTVCTHLGCTPNWLENDKKFKCPCHGSGFKISGVNFEGPAPRPLERFAVKKNENNQVIVDKSRKFQQERGEWDNPDSYILLT